MYDSMLQYKQIEIRLVGREEALENPEVLGLVQCRVEVCFPLS